MKQFLIFLLTVTFLYACNGSQTVQTNNPSYPNKPSYPNAPSYPNEPVTANPMSQPHAPQPGDTALTRGAVYLDSEEIVVMESYPVQITLVLKGSLPTPCNQLRVLASPPDEQNRIQVDVYSVIDPAKICAQVLEPFDTNVGLGSFPSGHYSVWVNGKSVGEFDS
jgi:hypothetical protein